MSSDKTLIDIGVYTIYPRENLFILLVLDNFHMLKICNNRSSKVLCCIFLNGLSLLQFIMITINVATQQHLKYLYT